MASHRHSHKVPPFLSHRVHHKLARFLLMLEDVREECAHINLNAVVLKVVPIRHPAPCSILLDRHIAIVILDAVELHTLSSNNDFVWLKFSH